MYNLRLHIEEARVRVQMDNPYDAKIRIARLTSLLNTLNLYEDRVLEALHEDLGKPPYEAYLSEFWTVRQEVKHAIRSIKKWMKPQKIEVPLFQYGAKAVIEPHPLGVVLILAPWNYPFHLTIMPLIGALAAGNYIIVQLSPHAKATKIVLTNLFKEAFPNQEVVVAQEKDISDYLEHQYDYIFYTGGPYFAKEVMLAAAKNLTPVTLELGGKCPTVIDSSANIKQAAKRIAWSKFTNCGQTCVAPDYLIIEKKIAPLLIEYIKRAIFEFWGEHPIDNSLYGRIINEEGLSRLLRLLRDTKIIQGGRYDKKKCKLEPTLVLIENEDGLINKEEIFGPILPCYIYETEKELEKFLDLSESPLTLYYYGKTPNMISKLSRLRSGSFVQNDSIVQLSCRDLPFGGVGKSGIGSYHGKKSFDTFSQQKSIFKAPTWFEIPGRFTPGFSLTKLKKLLKFIE